MNTKKISIGLLFLILALVIVPGASAFPTYVPSVASSCGVCHVNPSGGGTLTAAGAYFKANGQLPPTPVPTPVPTATPGPTPVPTATPGPTPVPTATPGPTSGQKADVTFKVTDSTTGKAIEHAKVTMDRVTIETNDHGIAVFKNVFFGKHSYYVTKEKYLKAVGTISVKGKTTVNVKLKKISSEDNHRSD